MNKAKIKAAIKKLSPIKKSRLLMQAMGWQIQPEFEGSTSLFRIVDGSGVVIRDTFEYLGVAGGRPAVSLYREKNMGLAWKVHIWALSNVPGYYDWVHFEDIQVYADAQKKWLDQILALGVYYEEIPLDEYDIGQPRVALDPYLEKQA